MTELSYFYVVTAGLLSFLSPCVLPLIPGYISYISGSTLNELLEKKTVNIFPIILFAVGIFQSWNVALTIFNLCLISSIMTLGINVQWGNAGIVNFGVMGFAALGGLANIIISMPPTSNAWETGG